MAKRTLRGKKAVIRIGKARPTTAVSNAPEFNPEWLDEIARRARRAHADPEGGEPWAEVERQLLARVSQLR
jgi:hypothetical protein